MKVVFHADDFGLSSAVNDGILEAHERGLLGSTSLMVTAAAADEAARAARARPSLDTGIHLTLVEEAAVLPAARLPTVAPGGRFWPNHMTVAARYATGRWRVGEARAELAAQWVRFEELGLRASHADGHQHLHLLPGVFSAVADDARRRGVRFVRTTLADPLASGAGLVRRGLLVATRALAALARSTTTSAGLVPFLTVGFLAAGGAMTRPGLLAMLDHLRARRPQAIVEVMLHPGHRDDDTARRYGHWRYQWERDFDLLVDPALRDALAARGIEPTSFRALAAELAAHG